MPLPLILFLCRTAAKQPGRRWPTPLPAARGCGRAQLLGGLPLPRTPLTPSPFPRSNREDDASMPIQSGRRCEHARTGTVKQGGTVGWFSKYSGSKVQSGATHVRTYRRIAILLVEIEICFTNLKHFIFWNGGNIFLNSGYPYQFHTPNQTEGNHQNNGYPWPLRR
jgi:hypothetical protein